MYHRSKSFTSRVSLVRVIYQQGIIGQSSLPEGAPANVALAEILVAGGLLYQQVDLLLDGDYLVYLREVAAGQLVPDPVDDGEGALVQVRLGGLAEVVEPGAGPARGEGGRRVGLGGGEGCRRRGGGGVRVGTGAPARVYEAPVQQRVVDERL